MAVLDTVRPTTSHETTAPWLAEHERFLRELPADEPAAVKALRRLGIERFAALGFPTLRQEDWRFTNVAPVARGTFVRPQTDPDAADPARLAVLSFRRPPGSSSSTAASRRSSLMSVSCRPAPW